jgi:small ligand-binding sensory domain FIST
LSCDADALLEGFDRTFPNARRVGGLVSGSFSAGGHRLWCGSSTHHRGAVGVALRGAFVLDTLVAQGCRPIGAPMFVTRHRDNLVLELDGRMALEVLRELLDGLAEPDIRLARRALFVGVALPGNEGHVLGRGDFLVRNLIGVDPTSGGIGVAERLVDNAVIQFHVRDAETSDEDLRAHLAMRDREPARTAGALMFTCMGRGRRLYGEPDHESGILRAAYGELPVAGFFCNGEIGPVGGTTHLHGYTSVIASFVRPPA